MKYYLDQEFIEGFRKSIKWLPTIGNFNKKHHFIDLISIGLVAEDGRQYYAICHEFNPNEASDWVKKNVLKPIMGDFYLKHYKAGDGIKGKWNLMKSQYWMFKKFGKSRKQIANEIVHFIDQRYLDPKDHTRGFIYPIDTSIKKVSSTNLEFYGYYADYDWVLFCSLFGTMMDLPEGFPMYCKDLKQIIDEKADNMTGFSPISTLDDKLWRIKRDHNYPKQENEHNALADAKWNKKLHEFLKLI